MEELQFKNEDHYSNHLTNKKGGLRTSHFIITKEQSHKPIEFEINKKKLWVKEGELRELIKRKIPFNSIFSIKYNEKPNGYEVRIKYELQPFRKFLGRVKNFYQEKCTLPTGEILSRESKEDKDFQKKHLKAYLKGNERFRHGYYIDENGIKQIRWFVVQQQYLF